jgi:4-hydroxy-3-methylbut-2-enyl diphosphate reductase
MEVLRARTAGFCKGVMLALRKLDSLLKSSESKQSIFTFGPIIHNPQVLEEYGRKGVSVVEEPEDVPPGSTVVIRAHGIPRELVRSLNERGASVIDATCPKVRRAQLLIEKCAQEGRKLLLYAEEDHPEAKGLLSYAEAGAFLFDSPEKIDSIHLEREGLYCLAAQTTQDREKFQWVVKALVGRHEGDITVLETICDATRLRQEETIDIAGRVDLMVVVGGYNSGNTRRLAQVASAQGTPVLHVETSDELDLDKLTQFCRVGLSAGASTPKNIIDEVHQALTGCAQG